MAVFQSKLSLGFLEGKLLRKYKCKFSKTKLAKHVIVSNSDALSIR